MLLQVSLCNLTSMPGVAGVGRAVTLSRCSASTLIVPVQWVDVYVHSVEPTEVQARVVSCTTGSPQLNLQFSTVSVLGATTTCRGAPSPNAVVREYRPDHSAGMSLDPDFLHPPTRTVERTKAATPHALMFSAPEFDGKSSLLRPRPTFATIDLARLAFARLNMWAAYVGALPGIGSV